MSGAIINPAALARYAHEPDIEIRGSSTGGNADPLVEQTGSFGGRVMRNVKMGLFFVPAKTAEEKASIIAAKQQTLDELKATFGADIGEKAFRAHIGRSDGQGEWESSANHPITGRHITAMVKTAEEEFDRLHPRHPEIPMLRKENDQSSVYVAGVQGGQSEERELRRLAGEGFANNDNRFVQRGETSDTPPSMKVQLPQMPAQFWKDVNRQQMLVHLPTSNGPVQLTKDNEPERVLADLAGSNQGAGHLAKFMTQDLFNTLNEIDTKLVSEGCKGGLVNPVPVDPRNVVQRIEATRAREAERDYVELAYTRQVPFKALSHGQDIAMMRNGGGDGQSRMAQSMQLRIAVEDLQAGRTDRFEIVGPPQMTVRAHF